MKVGHRTDGNDRVRMRCTRIRDDRRDKTVVEFAKIFRKKCTDKGMVGAVVRYKVSVQRVEVGKGDREFR